MRGESFSKSPPVPQPISSKRPSRPFGRACSSAVSSASAGRPRARVSSQSAPWLRKLSEAMRARSAANRAAARRSAASKGSSSGRRARICLARSASGAIWNQALAPSGERVSRPASTKSFKWRESRGWDWPRMATNSVTHQAPRAQSASSRSRVGSAAPRNWDKTSCMDLT